MRVVNVITVVVVSIVVVVVVSTRLGHLPITAIRSAKSSPAKLTEWAGTGRAVIMNDRLADLRRGAAPGDVSRSEGHSDKGTHVVFLSSFVSNNISFQRD